MPAAAAARRRPLAPAAALPGSSVCERGGRRCGGKPPATRQPRAGCYARRRASLRPSGHTSSSNPRSEDGGRSPHPPNRERILRPGRRRHRRRSAGRTCTRQTPNPPRTASCPPGRARANCAAISGSREVLGQPRAAAGDGSGDVRKLPSRRLNRAVGIADPRPGHCDIRMRVEPVREPGARVDLEDTIRVHQQQVGGGCRARAIVDAGGETAVLALANQLDVGKAFTQDVGSGPVAVVIDDDDRRCFSCVLDRCEASVELFVALVVDDDDRDAGRLPPNAH